MSFIATNMEEGLKGIEGLIHNVISEVLIKLGPLERIEERGCANAGQVAHIPLLRFIEEW